MKKFSTLLMTATLALAASAAAPVKCDAKLAAASPQKETVQFSIGEKQFKAGARHKALGKNAAHRLPDPVSASTDIAGEYVLLAYDTDYSTYVGGYASPRIEADGNNKYTIHNFIFSDALPVSVSRESTDDDGYDMLVIPSRTPLVESDGATYSLMLFNYGDDGKSPTVYTNDIPFLIDLETGDMMLAYENCGIAWLDLNSYSGSWIMDPLMCVPNAHLVGDEYVDDTNTRRVNYPMVALAYESGDIEFYNFSGMKFPVYMEKYADDNLYVAGNAIVDYYTYGTKDYPVYAYNAINEDETIFWLVGDITKDANNNLQIDLGTFVCALDLGWLTKMDDAKIVFNNSTTSPDPGVDLDEEPNATSEYSTANCIYGTQVDGFADKIARMSISLSNADPITALQFDLTLPEGFAVAYEDGSEIIDLSSRATRSHVIAASQLPGKPNVWRVLIYSNSNATFKDNDGEVVGISIVMPSTQGYYTAKINHVVMTTDEAKGYTCDDTTIGIKVLQARPGDANGDDVVNITDVVYIVNRILGKSQPDFVFDAADTNADGIINVTDVVNVVNMILGHGAPNKAPLKEEQQGSPTALYLSDFEIEAGQTVEVGVKLNNPEYDVSALEFSLSLPEGLSVAESDGELWIDAGSRASRSHIVASRLNGDKYKIVEYSTSSANFKEGDGDVLVITLVASEDFDGGTVTLSDISVSEADAIGHSLADWSVVLPSKYGPDPDPQDPDPEEPAIEGTAIFMPPFHISANETATVDVILQNADYAVSAVQFNMTLPEGLSVAEENGELCIDNGPRATRSHVVSSSLANDEYRVVAYSTSSADYKEGDGAILTVTFRASADFVGGSLYITDVNVSESNAVGHILPDQEILVNGISGIEATGADSAPVRFFTPAGIEMARPGQGVYIRVQGKEASKFLSK